MTPEERQILAEIEAIQQKLDQFNDTDPDYMPPLLVKLQAYVFQVHTNYETNLEVIIWKDYLRSGKPYGSFTMLFERLDFYSKQKIVHKLHDDFPNGITTKLNELRNTFAHQKGEVLRSTYDTDTKILKAYQLLERARDELDAWFAIRYVPGQ
jgi:hypothetical protein